jgi:sugar-specific transcriptional regulator TrmB
MKNNSLLEKIGLSKNESEIYLALLDLGPSSISKISEKTAIHRPLIYKTLPDLLEKKLISQTQKGKQIMYVAEPPNRLESIFDDLKYQFFELLPDLEDTYDSNNKKPKVRFLEGKDGTKRVFDDVVRSLKSGDTFYRYSSSINGKEKKDRYLPRTYLKIRDAKKLERMVITNSQTAKNKQEKLDRFIKVMPEDSGAFDYNITQIIYGERVAFIDYNSETALVIESKNIADFQKHIFKNLYNKLN